MKWALRLLIIFTLVSSVLAAQGIPEPISTNTGRQNAASSVLNMLKSAGKDLEMARNLTNVGSAAGTERCVKLLKNASSKLESASKVGNNYQSHEIGLILQQIDKVRFMILQSDSTSSWKAIDKIFSDVNKLVYRSVANESKASITASTEVPKPMLSQRPGNSSNVFNACGKEWKIVKSGVGWKEAQTLIKKLGNGWRTPTFAELKVLYRKVGKKSPIRDSFVWAESNDSLSAWGFQFDLGYESSRPHYFKFSYVLTVAVR